MFSQLGPLFKTTFRQAESNDTRQNIPHEERDKGRKKHEEDTPKEEEKEFWEESPSVSVGALRTFLINFLKTLPGAQDDILVKQETSQTNNIRPKEASRPTNTRNAKAVRAYQSMAEKAKASAPPPITNEKSTRVEPTADLLQSDELREVHKMIEDLDILARRGVENLNIRQADNFVESLKNAIQEEMSKV